MVLASIIAVYHLFKGMRSRDKVLCVARQLAHRPCWAITGVYRQLPTFAGVATIVMGKFLGGMIAVLIAIKISVPEAELLEKDQTQRQSTAIAAAAR